MAESVTSPHRLLMVIQVVRSFPSKYFGYSNIPIRALHLCRIFPSSGKDIVEGFRQKRFTGSMKLFTDEGNPFTLKVLSAFNVAKKQVEVEVVDRKSECLRCEFSEN